MLFKVVNVVCVVGEIILLLFDLYRMMTSLQSHDDCSEIATR